MYQAFSAIDQMVDTLRLVDHRIFVAASQFHHCSNKLATDNLLKNERGYALVKFYM